MVVLPLKNASGRREPVGAMRNSAQLRRGRAGRPRRSAPRPATCRVKMTPAGARRRAGPGSEPEDNNPALRPSRRRTFAASQIGPRCTRGSRERAGPAGPSPQRPARRVVGPRGSRASRSAWTRPWRRFPASKSTMPTWIAAAWRRVNRSGRQHGLPGRLADLREELSAVDVVCAGRRSRRGFQPGRAARFAGLRQGGGSLLVLGGWYSLSKGVGKAPSWKTPCPWKSCRRLLLRFQAGDQQPAADGRFQDRAGRDPPDFGSRQPGMDQSRPAASRRQGVGDRRLQPLLVAGTRGKGQVFVWAGTHSGRPAAPYWQSAGLAAAAGGVVAKPGGRPDGVTPARRAWPSAGEGEAGARRRGRRR